MRRGFYFRLAADGIRKNGRVFTPFILTCTGMVMMFYIILYLAVSDVLNSLVGEATLRSIFALGSWVIAAFAAVFLFYTNSFLIRRRKKEFGLYNILGMGKGNIARILIWETLIVAAVSIVGGLAAGIAFSKLAELGMVNVMHGEVSYKLSVSFLAVKRSLQTFGVIFLLLLANSIRQVQFASAVSLLQSESAGEKPPKGNWLLGLLGILLLAAAYYLAVTTENPITALFTFFVAVIMVIAGTYLVMISGSVVFCRLLQRKKSYYYKPNHFVSVSSMVYRMKRNGAGLASICVLATMVLVVMSSTACLYFGQQDAIQRRYPRDVNLEFRLEEPSGLSDEHMETMKNGVLEELETRDVTPKDEYFYRSANLYGQLEGNTVEVDPDRLGAEDVMASNFLYFYFVPLADYNAAMGTEETLEDGEVLLYSYREDYSGDTISFRHGQSFKIKKQVDQFTGSGDSAMDMLSSIMLVVPDLESGVKGLETLADFNGERLLQMKWIFNFDTGTKPEQQIELYRSLTETLTDPAFKEKLGYSSVYTSSQAAERNDFYALFGSLFYLGIILSLVFVIAAVLIIYYKQISEGYEDQARFEIMQKVGMTRREIRKSINSQLLTVFFLPLALAAVHLVFAFPIIRRLLLAFNLNDVPLLAMTTEVSVVVFAVFYTIVYRLTSNAYYGIVSGAREEE